MSILGFVYRRILHSIVVLFGLSILIFLLVRVVPGDPVKLALGPHASGEAVALMRAQLHLDKPLPAQYVYWLADALHGNFGESLQTRRPVSQDIAQYLPATFELAIFAGVVMAAGGILLGTLSAYRKDSWIDNLVRVLAYLGVVTPAFVFAVLFMLFFSYFEHWFPNSGRLDPNLAAPPRITGLITLDSLLTGDWHAFVNALYHLVLPGVALAMAGLSQQARIVRAALVDYLAQDFVAAHRTYGIPEWRILLRYALKPSLIPGVSILGLDFAALMGNAFLVELIFNWPGLSRYGIEAILQKDVNAVAATVLVLGVVFTAANILVDIVVAGLDPRIRLRMGREAA